MDDLDLHVFSIIDWSMDSKHFSDNLQSISRRLIGIYESVSEPSSSLLILFEEYFSFISLMTPSLLSSEYIDNKIDD